MLGAGLGYWQNAQLAKADRRTTRLVLRRCMRQTSVSNPIDVLVTSFVRPSVVEAPLAGTDREADRLRMVDPVERATRAVLFVDIVESVRLIENDEEGVVSRWLSFVEQVKTQLLPSCNGRLVKSLGDGLLLEFGEVRSAVSAAFAIQHLSNRENLAFSPDRQILLRIGIEVSDIIIEKDDVYGHGVNLAARLMTLAGPGEIVISAQARDDLTPVLDADVEDLGDCYVRHFDQPIRAYRIGPPGPRPVIERSAPLGELAPAIAVVPFSPRIVAADQDVLGEVIAEEIIRALSHSADLNRHFPDNPHIQGNRTAVAPPRELHSFRSHPMA